MAKSGRGRDQWRDANLSGGAELGSGVRRKATPAGRSPRPGGICVMRGQKVIFWKGVRINGLQKSETDIRT